MEEARPLAPQSIASPVRGCFPVLLMLLLAIVAFSIALTDSGKQLTPVHRIHGDLSIVIALGLGALCFSVMIGVKPRTWKTIRRGAGGSLLTAFVAIPVIMIALERVYESIDFWNMPVVESDRYLSIDSASIHHLRGGGIGYRVRLARYPVSLQIDRADYRSAFGDVGQVRPVGYCVHVIVQTAGKASRVLVKGGFGLPAGSLVHCPGP